MTQASDDNRTDFPNQQNQNSINGCDGNSKLEATEKDRLCNADQNLDPVVQIIIILVSSLIFGICICCAVRAFMKSKYQKDNHSSRQNEWPDYENGEFQDVMPAVHGHSIGTNDPKSLFQSWSSFDKESRKGKVKELISKKFWRKQKAKKME